MGDLKEGRSVCEGTSQLNWRREMMGRGEAKSESGNETR